MDEIVQRLFQFEGFALDSARGMLRHGCRDVELRPKSFDVLRCLLERAGRLVTKEEIIERVWPDVVVSDESVARCISDVRHALGDTDQRIIRTVHRRGYVFVAPVSQAGSEVSAALARANESVIQSTDSAQSAGPAAGAWVAQNWPRWTTIGCAAVLLVALASVTWSLRQPAGLPLPDRPSVAVLPFTNASNELQQEYLSDGISEDLSTGLSRFADLFVIARGSVFKYKGKDVDSKQVGRELGVRYLVHGSVRKDASRLRITAHLVEASTGASLWAEPYDREQSDLFAVQDEVTQKIVSRLVARITRSELDRALRKPPEALAAYDFYLRGNALMKNMPYEKRGAVTAAARALYENAIAIDPRYAPAVQGLANTYLMAWLEPSPDDAIIGREFEQQPIIDRAQALAQRAIELDGSLAEAHATLGWILYWQNRLKDGIAEFERGFQFNPNLVDARFAVLLAHGGRAPEEIDYMKRIMRLDPLYPPQYTYFLGKGYFFIGKYDEAIELIRSACARLPGYRPAHVLLAAVAAHLGRDQEARAAAAEVLRIQPNFSTADYLKWLRLVNQADVERVADGLRKAGLPE